MPREIKHTFKCDICGKEYTDTSLERAKEQAEKCEESHDIVYIPLYKSDVQALWRFLVSGNEDFLTKSLIETISRYRSLR